MKSTENTPTRRTFLGQLGLIFSGAIATVIGISGGLFALYPAFTGKGKDQQAWQTLGTLNDIPQGFTKFNVEVAEQTGWAQASTQQAVWVARQGEQLKVFSAVCPHEGCTISREPQRFICRCHLSQWQDDGSKIAGPTPRAMDQLSHQINDGQLQIKYCNFKRGVSEQQILD